jgi:hypothetical protein
MEIIYLLWIGLKVYILIGGILFSLYIACSDARLVDELNDISERKLRNMKGAKKVLCGMLIDLSLYLPCIMIMPIVAVQIIYEHIIENSNKNSTKRIESK